MNIKWALVLFLQAFFTIGACEKLSVQLFIQHNDGFNHFTTVQVTEQTTISELLHLVNKRDNACLNLENYEMLPAKKLASGDLWAYKQIAAPSHTAKEFLQKHKVNYIAFLQR